MNRAQSASGTSTTPRSSRRWRVPSSGSASAPSTRVSPSRSQKPVAGCPTRVVRPDVPAGRSRRGCSSAPSSVRTTSTTSSAGSGRERDLTALGEVGEQPHPGAVGRSQQRDPPGAEVVQEDGVGHPAVAEGAHRAAVGVGECGERVAVLVGEGHPAEAVVAAGEGLPRHPGADPAAAHARHDRPDAQLRAGRLVAPRPGGRLDEDADRRVLGLELVVVEQAAERALPGGPRRCGGAGRPCGRRAAASRAPRPRRRRRACSRRRPGRSRCWPSGAARAGRRSGSRRG